MKVQTGQGVKSPSVLHGIKRDVITTKTTTGELRNVYKIKSKKRSRRALICAIGLKERKLKNKKYTVVKGNTDNSLALESLAVVSATAGTVSQSGGIIRTAVRGTAKGAETIKTISKNGLKIGSRKDIGKIATVVSGRISNIAKDTGAQLLKTKIDKSTVTDTGTESIKQGLTDMRHVHNARKAVLNTARTTIKTGRAIKNMPKDTRAQVQRIKNRMKRARAMAKKTAEVIKKILTSKTGIIILLAVVVLLLLVFLISGLVTIICSAVSGLFAWMCPDGDTTNTAISDNISTYISQIQAVETEIQTEIDNIVNSLSPEYRYDGSQIIGLNKYKNSDLSISDYNAVLAVLATQKYRKVLDGGTADFSFTDEEIRNVVEMFYNFSYRYEYAYCPDCDCSIDESFLLSLSTDSFTISSVKYNSTYSYYEMKLQGSTYQHASSLTSV
ncbi:MAG TPA: hypothetical protein GX005_09505, partial [Bacteroidales bacterium]|nr:hypothetical protein [Bacteroidales bacterium]